MQLLLFSYVYRLTVLSKISNWIYLLSLFSWKIKKNKMGAKFSMVEGVPLPQPNHHICLPIHEYHLQNKILHSTFILSLHIKIKYIDLLNANWFDAFKIQKWLTNTNEMRNKMNNKQQLCHLLLHFEKPMTLALDRRVRSSLQDFGRNVIMFKINAFQC